MPDGSLQSTASRRPATREDHLERIRVLQGRAGRGLWLVVNFVFCSVVSYAAAGQDALLGERVRGYLGEPPDPLLISTALFVYVFSAVILTLGRIMEGKLTGGGWTHLAYLGAFYLFYLFAGALEEHFWAVFAAGMTVLSLEGYRIWTICTEKIRESEEAIERLARLEGFS